MDSSDFLSNRRQSVIFEDPGVIDSSHAYEANNVVVPPTAKRVDTTNPDDPLFSSPPTRKNTSRTYASSVVDDPWKRQYVLSLDGGGIRGYSSLLIIRNLIQCISDMEYSYSPPASTSFHPHEPSSRPQDESKEDLPEIQGNSFRAWRDKSRSRNILEDLANRSARMPNLDAESNGSSTTPTSKDFEANEIRARQNRNKYLPCHYFDYIGGTSTGGLITIMLSRLRMSVDDAIEEYEHLAGYIFGHPRLFSIRGPFFFPRDKYNAKRVVDVVEEVVSHRLTGAGTLVGHNLFASHERMCKSIVVSYKGKKVEGPAVTLEEPPFLFRSYDHHPQEPPRNLAERNPGYANRLPIWQVARATSAAPTYFNAITIEGQKFIDGGFGTNNPAREIFWEVLQMNNNSKNAVALVVSVGTGQSPLSRFSTGRLKKYITYVKAAKQLAVDAEKVHSEMLREIDDGKYYRFNVSWRSSKKTSKGASSMANGSTADAAANTPSHENILRQRRPKPLGRMALDEWKPESRLWQRDCNVTLRDIKNETLQYLNNEDVKKHMHEVARKLVENRRERCDKEHWEFVSTGAQYRCKFEGCHSLKSQKMRQLKKSLVSHLEKTHGIKDRHQVDEYVEKGRCPY